VSSSSWCCSFSFEEQAHSSTLCPGPKIGVHFSGPALLGAGGSFNIDGVVTASKLEIFLTGGLGAVPDIVVYNYSTEGSPFNLASGFVTVDANGQIEAFLNGVNFGAYPDLNASGKPTGTYSYIKADLGFVATVPEPGAALLYGTGLLIAAASVRRRAVQITR
jgi:hypothetical protein